MKAFLDLRTDQPKLKLLFEINWMLVNGVILHLCISTSQGKMCVHVYKSLVTHFAAISTVKKTNHTLNKYLC